MWNIAKLQLEINFSVRYFGFPSDKEHKILYSFAFLAIHKLFSPNGTRNLQDEVG